MRLVGDTDDDSTICEHMQCSWGDACSLLQRDTEGNMEDGSFEGLRAIVVRLEAGVSPLIQVHLVVISVVLSILSLYAIAVYNTDRQSSCNEHYY